LDSSSSNFAANALPTAPDPIHAPSPLGIPNFAPNALPTAPASIPAPSAMWTPQSLPRPPAKPRGPNKYRKAILERGFENREFRNFPIELRQIYHSHTLLPTSIKNVYNLRPYSENFAKPFRLNSEGEYERTYPYNTKIKLSHSRRDFVELNRIRQLRRAFSDRKRGAKGSAQSLKRWGDITETVLKKSQRNLPDDVRQHILNFARG